MKAGFIGLGKMGAGMVRNLLRAGHGVTVYNRTRDKAEALAESGAAVADSPADAASGADAVFTMLADDQAVTDVVFGERGLASGLAKDAVHISSSTISAGLARVSRADLRKSTKADSRRFCLRRFSDGQKRPNRRS